MSTPASVLIVGAAAAGLSTADALHRRKFAGPITVIGEEHGTPYDRPPLSKQVLSGDWLPDRAALMPAHRLAEMNAEMRFGVRATGLDVATRTVTTADGTTLHADAIVIATGVRARTLPDFDRPGVHVLRTMEDAIGLRESLLPGRRLVIVGGGLIGLEAAATARKLDVEVTVVEPMANPMAARIGERATERLLGMHREHGVEMLFGIGATRAVGEGHVTGVELSDGRVLPADVVLVAIGCVPNTEWLEGSGLTLDNGVVCDEYCVAGDGIWAAGDVARWRHLGLGVDLRVEHRQNASEQGRVVAHNILGEAQTFTPVPFFWTDHYEAKLQLAGIYTPGATETPIEVPSESGDKFAVAFHVDGRLIGALGWNAPQVVTKYRRELATPDVAAAG